MRPAGGREGPHPGRHCRRARAPRTGQTRRGCDGQPARGPRRPPPAQLETLAWDARRIPPLRRCIRPRPPAQARSAARHRGAGHRGAGHRGRGTGGGEGPASAAQARPSGAGKAWREKRARPTGGRPRPQGSSGRAIPGDLVSLGPLCCSVDTGLRPTPRPPPKLPRLAVFGHRPLLTRSSP